MVKVQTPVPSNQSSSEYTDQFLKEIYKEMKKEKSKQKKERVGEDKKSGQKLIEGAKRMPELEKLFESLSPKSESITKIRGNIIRII